MESEVGSVMVGDDVSLAVEIANNAGLQARNVLLSLPAPTGAMFVQADISGGGCATTENVVECSVPLLEPGQNVTGTISFEAQTAGSLDLQATVQSDLPEANASDNADEATVDVEAATAPTGPPPPAGGGAGSGGGGGGLAPFVLLLLASQVAKKLLRSHFG
jgi:hypothetical protein